MKERYHHFLVVLKVIDFGFTRADHSIFSRVLFIGPIA